MIWNHIPVFPIRWLEQYCLTSIECCFVYERETRGEIKRVGEIKKRTGRGSN